jgi:signal transduction histidine kinase
MLTRLETSFEQQRRFMADASHELRTPLAIMRGEAEVALQKDTRAEDEYRETLEIIRQEGVRLSNIVEDLFTLARADAGQYKLNRTTFYLDELVFECGRAVRTLVANKNLKFELAVDENLIFNGDEVLIRRLLIILLDNAIKYANRSGEVFIECLAKRSNYEITISNTGLSIPAAEQTHIFDRFYRADKARSHKDDYALGTGAGLGLSIGTWIARIHEGQLELVNSDVAQTTFRVYLPKN